MKTQDLLAEGVLSSKTLLLRYAAGFNEVSRVRQTPDLPNHLSWSLGHCALTMHRAAEKLDGRTLPETDFVEGELLAGNEQRFATESVAFGSRPEDRHDHYPTLARSIKVYENACDRLAAGLRAASDADLDKSVRWGPGEIPMYQLAFRMVFHNGTHTGQIADLRRALGFRSIFG